MNPVKTDCSFWTLGNLLFTLIKGEILMERAKMKWNGYTGFILEDDGGYGLW